MFRPKPFAGQDNRLLVIHEPSDFEELVILRVIEG